MEINQIKNGLLNVLIVDYNTIPLILKGCNPSNAELVGKGILTAPDPVIIRMIDRRHRLRSQIAAAVEDQILARLGMQQEFDDRLPP